jgi:hypothetical protein
MKQIIIMIAMTAAALMAATSSGNAVVCAKGVRAAGCVATPHKVVTVHHVYHRPVVRRGVVVTPK